LSIAQVFGGTDLYLPDLVVLTLAYLLVSISNRSQMAVGQTREPLG